MKLPTKKESHGSRPPPLKVVNYSLKKTARSLPPSAPLSRRPPVITYLRSPRVIRVEPRNFMRVVQQLTGNSSSSCSSSETNRSDFHGTDEVTSNTNKNSDQDAETEEEMKWYILDIFDTTSLAS